MDETEYSPGVISRFRKKKLFHNDPVLKKFYDADDVSRFRARLHRLHKDKDFKDFVGVIITDAIRYELYAVIDELTEFLKPVGDLILSGGDAVNSYLEPSERIMTLDIDTKFVPRFKPDEKFFGKLQAVKLLLWDKLGELAKRVNTKFAKIAYDKRGKPGKFIGFGFAKSGPYVTRRYTLIPKRKGSKKGPDTLADIELFTLDMKARIFSPKTGRIEDINIGGILDIAFMRPKEFGFDVGDDKVQALDIFKITGKYVIGKFDNIKLASKKFLIEDAYTMQKLGLRPPEKKEKDRTRMIKLAKLVTRREILPTDSMETIMRKVNIPLKKTHKTVRTFKPVKVNTALKINPRKYTQFTTTPDPEKLSKQYVHGLHAAQNMGNSTVSGYTRTYGNMRFDTETLDWVKNDSTPYVKNEYNYRPKRHIPIPKNIKMEETLYGFKPTRDAWVPNQILRKSATIPFVGVKDLNRI
jgi:hypothetical protein